MFLRNTRLIQRKLTSQCRRSYRTKRQRKCSPCRPAYESLQHMICSIDSRKLSYIADLRVCFSLFILHMRKCIIEIILVHNFELYFLLLLITKCPKRPTFLSSIISEKYDNSKKLKKYSPKPNAHRNDA